MKWTAIAKLFFRKIKFCTESSPSVTKGTDERGHIVKGEKEGKRWFNNRRKKCWTSSLYPKLLANGVASGLLCIVWVFDYIKGRPYSPYSSSIRLHEKMSTMTIAVPTTFAVVLNNLRKYKCLIKCTNLFNRLKAVWQ